MHGGAKTLGFGFSEAIYKDAMLVEFCDNNIPNTKELELKVIYKNQILKHKFFADFLCFGNIIVEVKSCDKGITNDYIAQTLNYLRASDNTIGLIVNFGKRRLEYKRLVSSHLVN